MHENNVKSLQNKSQQYSAISCKDTPSPVRNNISFCERILSNLKHISYEPVLMLYTTSCMLTMIASFNVMLEKACRVNLNSSEEICSSLRQQNQTEKYHQQEEILQKYTSPSINLRTYIIIGIPCIFLPFVGSFSDRTGYRKIIAIVQVTAQMIVCVHDMMHVCFMANTGLFSFTASEALIEGLGGGFSCLLMTAFSHISEKTTIQERTFRLGLLFFSQSVSFPIGISVGGPVLKHFGYYSCYGISFCLHLVNLTYVVLYIKDKKKNKQQNRHDGHGFLYFIRTFFDLSNVKETIRVVFKKGPNKRRLRMIVLLSIVSILFGPVFGELAILYMSTRYRFGWDELQFSMFQTYNFVTHTLGTVFSLIVFSKALKWHDSVLGIISTLSKIAGSFIYCFAPTGRIFYLAPLIEILNGTSLLAMRSIISKLVAPDELGKVNSIFGLTENLMPLIYVPLYTTVYTATMKVLPGAVFLMGASMTTPAVAVFFWLFYEHRKGLRRLKKEEEGTLKEAEIPLNVTEEIPLN